MSAADLTHSLKSSLRKTMRKQRAILKRRTPTPNLLTFKKDVVRLVPPPAIIAAYSPIKDEFDIWPLLKGLYEDGKHIALPVIKAPNHPLIFREWTPRSVMKKDRYGVSYPADGKEVTPQLILVPLLAFTATGERLGYGGGYYDRTLEALRRNSEVFACGVAYAGQEVAKLPTDAYDAKLDGILTEDGFRAFA